MKYDLNKRNTSLNIFSALLIASSLAGLGGCDPNDPQKEDVPELITKVTLTFTPTSGTPIVGTATDPDGLGLKPLETDGSIHLNKTSSYALTITMINELAEPASPEYNVTNEVYKEGTEHMFFFSWTNNIFLNPSGNGNLDLRNDPVNYTDEDLNGQPLGIETTWTTTGISETGTFRIVLKHQPDLKSATSDSSVGETDMDVPFDIEIY